MEQYKKNPMFKYLIVLTGCSMLGLQAWQTMFNNFAVDIVHLEGSHVGIIQAVREIPGLLSFTAIFIMHLLHEHRMAAASILFLGIWMAVTGFLPSYAGLISTTLFMSFGFHYYETTNQSLTLQYFDAATSPKVLGSQRSLAALSNICASGIIFVIASIFEYRHIYLFFGLVIVAVAVWAFLQNPVDKDLVPQKKRIIMRRKYSLFYILTFLAGARRQIFIVFAPFLLVKHFHFTIQEIAILFIINNIINYFLSPAIGRAIIRFGERRVMTLEYTSLVFLFIAYANIESKILAGVLYILDYIFFNFAIAVNTYFQKVGDPADIAPSMAIGFTINHIAAVVIPVVGGILWLHDYRIPFYSGVALCAVMLIFIQKIRLPRKT